MRLSSSVPLERFALAFIACLGASVVQAQGTSPASSQEPAPETLPTFATTVTVIGTTPLPGIGLPLDKVPAPVQTVTDRDITRIGARDVSGFLNQSLTSVHVNDIQGNSLQTDVSYRGYTASPLLGTPQGLSIYVDGVRMNQPFGDVVSWDLIPRIAIGTVTMMPGSNPLFGLNTLGGALALQTKDGRAQRGTSIEASYGSHAQRTIEFEHGGATATRHWYFAGNYLGDDGWRDESPSTVRQIFGKAGWTNPSRDLTLTGSFADNTLNGNGLQEQRLLESDYSSVYTKPDITDNRLGAITLAFTRRYREGLSLTANAYFRHITTGTLNGDLNDDSLDQSVYQPSAAERAALIGAGYTDVPASGATAANTPFPFWRCLGNILLRDEPAEKCNGLINRSDSRQDNAGAFAQLTQVSHPLGGVNQLTVGGGFDGSSTNFTQSTELGYLNPDRSVAGTGAFADGVNGGGVDGEPFDTRVDLDGRTLTVSAYATNTLSLGGRWHLTLAGRYNRTGVRNRDQILPGGVAGSLDGDHVFQRFNPSAGVTVDLPRGVNVYAGFSEGSRAATSIELGCADPALPCKLPNAMAGDPPLDQVVTRTFEAGIRGGQRLAWSAGLFRADNHDDILFVSSSTTGFGYFRNFGETRRAGAEVGGRAQLGRLTVGGGYTFLAATYESDELIQGEGNSANDSALSGVPGVEGTIDIAPGDHIPLVPRHMLKAYAELRATSRLTLDTDLVGISRSFARGNENNDHEPVAPYYLGPGSIDGYAVTNLGARYQLSSRLTLVARLNNLFDHRYNTAAQLGATGFTADGRFIARPFAAINGQFPIQQSTFYAPGAPRAFWIGARAAF